MLHLLDDFSQQQQQKWNDDEKPRRWRKKAKRSLAIHYAHTFNVNCCRFWLLLFTKYNSLIWISVRYSLVRLCAHKHQVEYTIRRLIESSASWKCLFLFRSWLFRVFPLFSNRTQKIEIIIIGRCSDRKINVSADAFCLGAYLCRLLSAPSTRQEKCVLFDFQDDD